MGPSHVLLRSPNGHLPVLKYLHENGCPWDWDTCSYAAYYKHWDCLQYAVDNKCPEWEIYAKRTREAPPMKCHSFVLQSADRLLLLPFHHGNEPLV